VIAMIAVATTVVVVVRVATVAVVRAATVAVDRDDKRVYSFQFSR